MLLVEGVERVVTREIPETGRGFRELWNNVRADQACGQDVMLILALCSLITGGLHEVAQM